ncbi:hypothetical protein JVT61DRAFT_9371 [Boletus reticuloceps]|uniref:Uncharacterized protein n=1 Tax=Boletus reticuloceps TaxID=495285 RepID=A0A8I2YH00_9AGAM|nr:hypothetical protein JVT61DRAFT_9371 [Boletus reticuloceps]
MPSYPALVVAFALLAAVRSLPVDEISARNGIGSATSGVGGQAAGGSVSAAASSCTSPLAGCAVSGLLGTSLLKVASGKHVRIIPLLVSSDTKAENAGNGGSALSGAASGKALLGHIDATNSTSKVPVGSGFSGAGGEAPGGSVVDNHPALIEMDSDNAGQGGNASSGNSSGLVN